MLGILREWELVGILIIALLFIGKILYDTARSLGKGVTKFKEGLPVKVYSTFNQLYLSLAKCALGQARIPYITYNENFAALFPGADGLATVDILVNPGDVKRAGKILEPFIIGKR